MHRSRIFLVLGLIALALLLAVSAAFLSPIPHEIVVPIDRSVLQQQKPKGRDELNLADSPKSETSRSRALAPVPDPRLIEKTEFGHLPRLAENGDRAANIYARPYEPTESLKRLPKLAFVLLRSGISETRTIEAYVALPPEVSFSVSPYAQDAQRQIRDIRNRGHEIFLDLPSKTEVSTREDRGPEALDPDKDVAINREHLYSMMSRFSGYVGFICDWTPVAFQTEPLRHLVHDEARQRGLALIHIVRPHSNALQLFDDPSDPSRRAPPMMILPGDRPAELVSALQALPDRLKQDRRLIAFIDPGPLALDALKDWLIKRQSQEFDLVPLSALMRLEEQG